MKIKYPTKPGPLWGGYTPAGEVGLPVLPPYTGGIPKNLISFKEALELKEGKGLWIAFDETASPEFDRFFIDPGKFLPHLLKFDGALEPVPSPELVARDGSKFALFKCRLLAQLLERSGLKILPNLTYILQSPERETLGGIPHGGVYGIDLRDGFFDISSITTPGGKMVLTHLKPTALILFGREKTTILKFETFGEKPDEK